MSSSDQIHEMVCEYVLNLCSEKCDSTIRYQLDELSKIDYDAAMSVLVNRAESHGFTFSSEDWEWIVKKIIEAYPNQQDKCTYYLNWHIDLSH